MLPISGWAFFIFVGGVLGVGIGLLAWTFSDKVSIGILVAIAILMLTFFGIRWYYTSTASGQRQWLDEKSDLNNGIERIVNVYTADGQLMASYEGKIDLDINSGGYVKFDFEGNRYIYYNCFIETIAKIDLR